MSEKRSTKERRHFSLIPEHESQPLLPIACRFVPGDQWLVSHVDASWKIHDVKNWLLRKCNVWGASAPQPPKFRPASPVTFASRSSSDAASLYNEAEEEGEEEEDEDWDAYTLDHNTPHHILHAAAAERAFISYSSSSLGRTTSLDTAQKSSTSSKADTIASKFALVSFSNGHILDEDSYMSWYNLRPYEMLELHRVGRIIPLPRHSIDYVEPYFDSPAYELDSFSSQRDHSGKQKKTRPGASAQEKQLVEWKKRHVVIRDGSLYIHKDEDAAPLQRYPITSLCALSGSEPLGSKVASRSHILSAKLSLSPSQSREHVIQETTKQAITNKPSGVWIVLSMPDESSLSNIIRVLHRLAPFPISSSFVIAPTTPATPSPTPLSTPTSTSPNSFDSPAFAVEYPEWRMQVVARAHRAGLGELSPAMAHALYGAQEDDSSTQVFSQKSNWSNFASADMQNKVLSTDIGSWGDNYGGVSDSDVDSEVEWEGWTRDLSRRSSRPDPRSNRLAWVRPSSANFNCSPEPPPTRETSIGRARVSSTPTQVGFFVTTTTTTHVTTLPTLPSGVYNSSPGTSSKNMLWSNSDADHTVPGSSPSRRTEFGGMRLTIPSFTIPERRSEDDYSDLNSMQYSSPVSPSITSYNYQRLKVKTPLSPNQIAEGLEKSLHTSED